MSTFIEGLRQQRLKVWEQAKAIADKASDENRSFNGEEETEWQRLNAELEAYDRRIQATLQGEQRAKDSEEALNKLRGGTPANDRNPAAPTAGGTTEGDELRAFLRGEGPRFHDIRPSGPVNFRDLTKGTAVAGGNTVPTGFYNRLMEHMVETSAILQSGATILNTVSGESLPIPKTTAHSTATIVPESAAIPESDPAFGQITLGAYKYGDMFQVSRELLTDTGVDLEGYLARQAGRALGNAFGAHAITGTGTSQPRGVVTDASVGVTGPVGTATTFGTQSTAGQGADLLISLFHSVIAPYRRSSACGWIFNDTTAATIRKIKTSEGQYIWQPSVVIGQPDTILGKPVLIDPNVASPAANAKSVIFGDMSQYVVRLAGGIRFERSDEYAFNSDLVTFRALMRADSALVDLTGAVKVFVHSAT